MAPRQQQLPTRSSGRTPKPSKRKRAQSAPAPAILQPPKKKVKRKVKKVKKRQKLIPVPSPSPSPSPSPLSPATPIEPIFVDKGKDKNIEEPIEVEDEDVGSPSPPPPVRFTSVWKAVIDGGKESLPSIRSPIFNTKSIYYYKLDKWRNDTVLYLLPRKFKIT